MLVRSITELKLEMLLDLEEVLSGARESGSEDLRICVCCSQTHTRCPCQFPFLVLGRDRLAGEESVLCRLSGYRVSTGDLATRIPELRRRLEQGAEEPGPDACVLAVG